MLLRLDENVEIDTTYITCAEYQLFVDEKLNTGQPRQPDHWKESIFISGHATEPISGIRASDAVEFCEWLTEQHATQDYRFRLPFLSEVRNYPVKHQQKLQIGCWCKDGLEFVVAGMEPRVKQLWQAQVANRLVIKFDSRHNSTLYNRVLSFYQSEREIEQELYHKVSKFFDRKSNPELYRDLERVIDQSFFRELDRISDTHDKGTIKFDHNFFRFLETIQERDLTRELDRRRLLECNLFSLLNQFLSRNLDRNCSDLFNLNIYQEVWKKIESHKATDFQLLYFPLMVMVIICHQLSIIYARASENKSTLREIQLNSSRCEEISYFYEEKRDKIFPSYAYLVLLDERQSGQICAWEGLRIVRERIY